MGAIRDRESRPSFAVIWPCLLILFILGQFWGLGALNELRGAPKNSAQEYVIDHLSSSEDAALVHTLAIKRR